MKNRIVFLVSALAIMGLAFGLSANPSSNIGYKEMDQITIAVATDLHYLAPELTDQGKFFQEFIKTGDGKVVHYCEELTEAFVEQIIAEKPDALILSGDITFNGEKQSHIKLAEKLRRVKDTGIIVLVMPGNHDMDSTQAASFHGDSYTFEESVDMYEFEEIYRAFGYSEALEKDDASLSFIAELTPELRVLMLDANSVNSMGLLADSTIAWVEEQLQKAEQDGARVVAVSHQNVLQHNSLFSFGYMIVNNASLLELYEKYNVICNLSGHIHMQHITQSENGMPEITTSALSVSPNQYGVLTLSDGDADYHTVQVDVSSWASANGYEDIADFADISYTFMWDTAYRQAATILENHPNANQMSRFYADINTAYFAGRMDTVTWDDVTFENWNAQESFLPTYMQTIAEDGFKNQTEYSFNYK